MDSGPNSSPFERRIGFAFMARDQQQNPVSGRNCALQRPIDRIPGAIKAVPMQVEHSVGIYPAGPEPPVPAAVERCLTKVFGPFWR